MRTLLTFSQGKQHTYRCFFPTNQKALPGALILKPRPSKVDVAILCRIELERILPAWKIPCVVMKQIRSLCREYKSLKTSGATIKVRLHAYKYSYKPEQTTMARLKQQLLLLEKQMVMVEKEIKSYISQEEPLQKRVENIQQVKGLSLITIITLIAETNGFAAITNAKPLTSYSGLDITMNQSGQFYGRTKISKKGTVISDQLCIYLP